MNKRQQIQLILQNFLTLKDLSTREYAEKCWTGWHHQHDTDAVRKMVWNLRLEEHEEHSFRGLLRNTLFYYGHEFKRHDKDDMLAFLKSIPPDLEQKYFETSTEVRKKVREILMGHHE